MLSSLELMKNSACHSRAHDEDVKFNVYDSEEEFVYCTNIGQASDGERSIYISLSFNFSWLRKTRNLSYSDYFEVYY